MKKRKSGKPAGRKLYSIPEVYMIAVNAFRSGGALSKCRKEGLMTEKLQERVMLAVNSVNSCAMCSYVHAGAALKAGLSNEEIQAFAAGEFPELPAEDAKAVLFAQHYADTRGKPEKASWEEIVREYGRDRAEGILGAARIMMMGNAMGIVVNSVRGRLKGEGGDARSGVLYETAFVLLFLPMVLAALVHVLILKLFRVPAIRFAG